MSKELTVMQQFLETLEKVGGVYKVDDIKDKVDLSNAILLTDENEIYTPVFQFEIDEDQQMTMNNNVEYILKEIRKRTTYSGVRLCNFFTCKQDVPHVEDKISVLELIKKFMNIDQHQWLDMKIQNVGTNNLL